MQFFFLLYLNTFDNILPSLYNLVVLLLIFK
nr:MAG TPA: hypothetical protein [Crassvirales sp.]